MRKRLLMTLLAVVLMCALVNPAAAFGDMGKAREYNHVSAGDHHTAAIDSNDSLWMWGGNEDGQLGDGTNQNSDVPVKVMDAVASVSCGGNHTAVIDEEGTLWTWGKNSDGQLGNGTTESSNVPVKVMDKVAAVSCGGSHTAAIKTDGTLWTWGYNGYGQLGNGTKAQSLLPLKVMEEVTAVSAGTIGTAVLKRDGSLSIIGNHMDTQVINDVVAACSGDNGYCIIKADGTLHEGTLGERWIPSGPSAGTHRVLNWKKVDMEDALTVRSGYRHLAALKEDGSLYLWGRNVEGQLGNGSMVNSDAPGLTMYDVNEVSCGSNHTVALKWDDTVWTWGYNNCGQLGNSTTEDSSVPKKIELKATPVEVPLHLNGGVGTMKLIADEEGKISPPVNPVKTWYNFAGWYTDSALTQLWNFNDKAAKGLQLYARWMPVSSTAAKTGKSQSAISLNGNTVTLDAYSLKAANGGDVTYVKLRDVATLLENTNAKFNVDWKRGAIYVTSKSAYTTKNGGELKAISGTDGSYQWNQAPVLFDGTTGALEGIVLTDGKGGGHTFFKLRDLGDAIGFTVGWSAQRGIFIETK